MNTIQFRGSEPNDVSQPKLGPLKDLPGTWFGDGFNLISLPDFHEQKAFRVKLNKTREVLKFDRIGAPIPNRGSGQDDIEFLGLHYLQEVNDAHDNSALHLEPGLWLNIPATTDPVQPATVVRQATIPHGDSLLAQGTSLVVNSGPKISVISSTPLKDGVPLTSPTYLAPLLNAVPPNGIPQTAIANPNILLTNAIAGQNIIETTVIIISTSTPNSGGGILNIPFVTANANATKLDAIFWIEKVQSHDGRVHLQLQYTQTVMLNFLGIDWPHISVATLIKR